MGVSNTVAGGISLGRRDATEERRHREIRGSPRVVRAGKGHVNHLPRFPCIQKRKQVLGGGEACVMTAARSPGFKTQTLSSHSAPGSRNPMDFLSFPSHVFVIVTSYDTLLLCFLSIICPWVLSPASLCVTALLIYNLHTLKFIKCKQFGAFYQIGRIVSPRALLEHCIPQEGPLPREQSLPVPPRSSSKPPSVSMDLHILDIPCQCPLTMWSFVIGSFPSASYFPFMLSHWQYVMLL